MPDHISDPERTSTEEELKAAIAKDLRLELQALLYLDAFPLSYRPFITEPLDREGQQRLGLSFFSQVMRRNGEICIWVNCFARYKATLRDQPGFTEVQESVGQFMLLSKLNEPGGGFAVCSISPEDFEEPNDRRKLN